MAITAVIHVDVIFAVGLKSWRDRLCEGLGRTVSENNLGELSWYGGCQFTWDLPML